MSDTKSPPQNAKPKASPERVAKESKALRENLRKRKEQAQLRQTIKKGT
jgi:hypothetical protein